MFRRVVTGVAIVGCSAAAFVACSERPKKFLVKASWTTNSKPTCRWDDNWDRRDPKSCTVPQKDSSEEEKRRHHDDVAMAKPSASRFLYLIRHGQYNMQGASEKDLTLTELGCKQADLTGQRLKHLGVPFTLLVHSTMPRAVETAQLIHKHLQPVKLLPCQLVREGAPVRPDPALDSWRPDAQFFEDGARIEAGFRKYFYRADPGQQVDSHEIIVCHANVIRYWVCRALQLPPEAWSRLLITHGSITVVCILPSGRVSLHALGDTGHFPPDMITTN